MLPALDLPVSRTGVEVHYSPRFRLKPAAGAFRVEAYTEPLSATLRDDWQRDNLLRVPASAAPSAPASGDKDGSEEMAALVQQFKQAGGGRLVPGVFPVDVLFPSFGDRLFMATELTPDTQAPQLRLEYHRERGN